MITKRTSAELSDSPRLRGLKNFVKDEEGQSVVEAGIAMIALLVLMFAVIESSWAIYYNHYLGNVAHEATRYAIVRGGSWSSSCAGYNSTMCKASTTDIANFVVSRNFPGINIAASDVCVQYFSAVPASTSNSCTANTSPNSPGNIVQVTINHPFTLTVPFIPAVTWKFKSTSQMVISQ